MNYLMAVMLGLLIFFGSGMVIYILYLVIDSTIKVNFWDVKWKKWRNK